MVLAEYALRPASALGRLLMSRIHLSRADVGATEEQYVLAALRSGWVAPLGPDVDRFEAEMAHRVGATEALALSSGTAALHLGLLGLGARPGTVVVCASMTFAASANAIEYTGATPVFVDSDAMDGNVDPMLVLEAVDTLQAEGVEVAAALIVDLFGRCADYSRLSAGLAARGVPILEDAAEALGSTLNGRAAGSFGAAAVVSFNGNKVLTTSGGGMLLSEDADLVRRARYLVDPSAATGSLVRTHRNRVQLPAVQRPCGAGPRAVEPARRDGGPATGDPPPLRARAGWSARHPVRRAGGRRPRRQLLADVSGDRF